MPYPNEHACRLNDPGRYERFARDNDKDPNVVYGVKANGKSEIQAYRYPKTNWTAARARSHCEKHDGTFEAASSGAEDRAGMQIRNVTDGLDFLIYGVIGGGAKSDSSAKDVVERLSAAKTAKTITLSINSPGGDVFDGVAIYNALKQHPARVTVNVDGMAGSVASIIAMAGDEIRMAENAMMMLHDPVAVRLQRGGAEELRQKADVLDKLKEMIVSTYANRAKIEPDKIHRMMADETWLDAEEAVKLGFADTIVPAKKLAAFAELADYEKVPKTWLAKVLADNSQAVATARQVEVTNMADEDKTLDVAEVRKEGATAETERFKMLDEAFEDKAFVAEMFRSGVGMDKAKALFDAREKERLASEVADKAAKITEYEDKIAELSAQVEVLQAKKAKDASDDGESDALPFKPSEGGSERETVIAKGRKEFADETAAGVVICEEEAWINCCLTDAGAEALTEDEILRHVIRQSA